MNDPRVDSKIPKISVVMSVYNDAPFVREAIESILKQTFDDFEFIVIDDGSKDGSSDILALYAEKDSRIRIFRQENSGLIAALNHGLKYCRAPLIARMDGDDISLPYRFEAQVEVIEKHPNFAVIGSQVVFIDTFGKVIGESVVPTHPEYLRDHLLLENCIFHPSVLMRKEAVLNCGGYSSEAKHAEDYDLWARMVQAGWWIGNTADVLLRYRYQRSESIGVSKAKEQDISAGRIRKSLVEFARSPKGWLDTIREEAICFAFPAGSHIDQALIRIGAWDMVDPIGLRLTHSDLKSCQRAWLTGKSENVIDLLERRLREEGHQFLSDLLLWHAGRREAPSLRKVDGCGQRALSRSAERAKLSIIVPCVKDLLDLHERVADLYRGKRQPDEVIVALGDGGLKQDARQLIGSQRGIRIITTNSNLPEMISTARAEAEGEIIGYLLPGYRFHPDFFSKGTELLFRKDLSLVFATYLNLYQNVFLNGKPLLETNKQVPKSRREILLQAGKSRRRDSIYLSGFLHLKEGDWGCVLPIAPKTPFFDWILAMDWAYREDFAVLEVCNFRMREGFRLEDRTWTEFLFKLLGTYFECAYGRFPASGDAPALSRRKLDQLKKSGHPIHGRYQEAFFKAYLCNGFAPWLSPVFRELCTWNLIGRSEQARKVAGKVGQLQVLIAWTIAKSGRFWSRLKKEFGQD